MTPGTPYTGQQVARLTGYSLPEVQRVLSGCVARGIVRQTRDDRHSVYRVPTEEEILRAGVQMLGHALPQTILQGYDAEHRRFREMCMASRRPVSGRPNSDDEPHV
ncbi:hypothetical protein R75461_07220 [Paraburkholderia nemoris]|nr:hypothetical protein R75461_07220 [Paraburkholderia nemoris]